MSGFQIVIVTHVLDCRAHQSMIKQLQSMCAGGRSVSGAGVLLSLVGMVCGGGASLCLVLAVLEVMRAVVRGQWPPAWSSHCVQLAALLKVHTQFEMHLLSLAGFSSYIVQ